MSAEPIPPKPRLRTIEILVALGYLLLILIAVFGCYFIFYLSSKQNAAALPSYAQNTPQPTPAPHITTAILASSKQIFDENFLDNSRQWAYYHSAQNNGQTVGIKDRQLTLQSDRSGSVGIATCSPCLNDLSPTYIEADLTTDISTDDTHGLVFELTDPDTDKLHFYSFVIDSQARTYSLYHYAGSSSTVSPWSLRLRGSSQFIQAFPKYNVVGLYLDTGLAEFYINGNLVDTYRQVRELFQTGSFGLYVDNYGFKVIASHLAYFTLNGAKP
jgi:hypothetical protein